MQVWLLLVLFVACSLVVATTTTAPTAAATVDRNNGLRRLVVSEGAAQTRIHGGWPTTDGRYGYGEVTLLAPEGHKCGGVVVAPDLILSAAHCQRSESQYTQVIVGKHSEDDVTFQAFRVTSELLHPQFDLQGTRFDVMLLKLDGRVERVAPVRINSDPAVPVNGEMLTVIGLGFTEEWQLPTVLHETTVTYTRNLDCADMTDAQGQSLKQDLSLDMLCAGDPGRDSCYGDSGSPLIRPGADSSSDVAVGIVSWGYECAGDLPGVYARLSHSAIEEWLVETICRESVGPPAYLSCAETTEDPTAAPSPRPSPRPSPAPTLTPTLRPTLPPTFPPTVANQPPTLEVTTMPQTAPEGAPPSTTESPTSGALRDAVMDRFNGEEDSPAATQPATQTPMASGTVRYACVSAGAHLLALIGLSITWVVCS